MDYSKSICFSAVLAEELNKKAFLLNKSLFLFAYYEPTPYNEKESSRTKFTTAIINLYGLFWDCGPFVFELFKSRNSILLTDWPMIKAKAEGLRNLISAFRTIFCHNCSDQLLLNVEKISDANRWIIQYGWQDVRAISEDGWNKLFVALVTEVDSLTIDIGNALDELNSTQDFSRKENAINWWIKQIAISYQRNPDYLLNTMAELYILYLKNTNTVRDPCQRLRYLTKRWLCLKFNCEPSMWYEKWLEPTEQDGSKKAIETTNLYAIIKDWPNRWALWYNSSAEECDIAPMPANGVFHILADNIVQYARNPQTAILEDIGGKK